eukprot:GHVT01037516.1.p1 GENE.GHVT01037516.1~~GHVT01037516.1.p1  ORF type:complete len:533 (+),score=74.31 GHVT01037516.1:4034-5632(+)
MLGRFFKKNPIGHSPSVITMASISSTRAAGRLSVSSSTPRSSASDMWPSSSCSSTWCASCSSANCTCSSSCPPSSALNVYAKYLNASKEAADTLVSVEVAPSSSSSSNAAPASSFPPSSSSSSDADAAALSGIISACSLYCLVSVSIVYLNWWVFTGVFRYPTFVSWIQQITGVCMYYLFAWIGHVSGNPSFARFPFEVPKLSTAMKVAPLTFAFVGMVGAANICLKYAQVSTYQVARSLTLIITGILSYLILKQKQSKPTMLACAVVVLGFIIGALDPTTLTFLGVLFGAISSFFQALYNVMIKKALVHVNNDTNRLLMYNLIVSSILFFPACLLAGESQAFFDIPKPSHVDFYSVWIGIIGSGILATVLNLATYLCVKVTSPLTFNIVGMTKACIQSVGGIVFLGDIVTLQSLVGIILTLVGSATYSQVKLKERKLTTSQIPEEKQKLTLTSFSASDSDSDDSSRNDVEATAGNEVDKTSSQTLTLKYAENTEELHHRQQLLRQQQPLVNVTSPAYPPSLVQMNRGNVNV